LLFDFSKVRNSAHGRAEPSGRHGCRLTRVGLLKTKKSLELLSKMSECLGNPSRGLSKNNCFNSL